MHWMRTTHQRISKPLTSTTPLSPGALPNPSVGSFADDLIRLVIADDPRTLVRLTHTDTCSLDQAVMAGQYAQNADKAEIIMHLTRPRLAHAIQKVHTLIGRYLPTFNHPGARLTPNGSEHHEIPQRFTAMARGWNTWGTAWVHLPRGVRRALFVCLVQSAGLSGLQARVLTPGNARRFDVAMCRKL